MRKNPKYPKFEALTIEKRSELLKYMDKHGPYADFNFTNMFVWSSDEDAGISWLNGNLVLRLRDYITGEYIYSVCGTKKIDETLETLLNDYKILYLVPEIVREKSQLKTLNFQEDRDAFDYIYKTKTIIDLPGNNYKKKRNKISKASNDIGHRISVENKITLDESTKRCILEVFDKWASDNERTLSQTQQERVALVRLLDFSDRLNCIFTIIKMDDEIIAFSVNEIIKKSYALCHFEKAKKVHVNILSYVAYLVTIELHQIGIKSMNWEQDLGLPGLRQAKESYNPDYFLKKYTVTHK